MSSAGGLTPKHSLHRLRTISTGSDSSFDFSSLSPLSATTTTSTSRYESYDYRMTPSSVSTARSLCTGTRDGTPLGSPVQLPWTPDTWEHPSISSSQASRVIRKKKSKAEIRQQEERQQVRGDLLGMIEPRPGTGVARGGIEEVLHGEA